MGFKYISIDPIILYILLFVWIIYGIIKSDNKKKALFKLIFIWQFWSLFTLIYSMLSNDINILNSILLVFLINYISNDIDLYSDLDPSNSKHILDALHNLLKEINFKDLLGQRGGGPDPDFLPYMYMFINTDEEPDKWTPSRQPALDFDSAEVKDVIKKVDDHNKKIVKVANDSMLEEKNQLFKLKHENKPRIAESGPYTFTKYDALTKAQIRAASWINFANGNLLLFFHNFKDSILSDIMHYDRLIACKIYYESPDKTILPGKFKNIWVNWHSSQCGWKTPEDCLKLLIKKPTRYYPNFYKGDIVYKELYDNILIVGLDLLCRYHIYTHLNNLYIQDPDISKFELFNKGWEYYEEAETKYYPFFHHYQWYSKLYYLDKYSESELLSKVNRAMRVDSSRDSIPPLYNSILSWDIKPQWYNDIRPLPDYLQRSFSYVWGSKLVFFVFDSKDFFTKKPLVLKPMIVGFNVNKDFLPKIVTAKDVRDNVYIKPLNIKHFYLNRDTYFR